MIMNNSPVRDDYEHEQIDILSDDTTSVTTATTKLPKTQKRAFDVAFLLSDNPRHRRSLSPDVATTTAIRIESSPDKMTTQPKYITNKRPPKASYQHEQQQQKSAFTKVNLQKQTTRDSPDWTYQSTSPALSTPSPSPEYPNDLSYPVPSKYTKPTTSMAQTAPSMRYFCNYDGFKSQVEQQIMNPGMFTQRLRHNMMTYRHNMDRGEIAYTYNASPSPSTQTHAGEYPSKYPATTTTTTSDFMKMQNTISSTTAVLLNTLLPPSLAALSLPTQNVCAKCNISFRMTSDLVYHMRSHHKNESHGDMAKKRKEDKLKCPVCNESFRERHHLTRHMTAHQDKEDDYIEEGYTRGGKKLKGLNVNVTTGKFVL